VDAAYGREMKKYQDLAEYRVKFYAYLSLVYIQIPGEKILSIHLEPVLKLLGSPLKGTEKSLQEIKEGLRFINDYILKTDLSSENNLLNLTKDWTHLFRGVDVKGSLPPYESLYRTGKLQGKPAQEISRLFSKKGIRVPEQWHQPLDYIGVELDFMRLLCSKEKEGWKKNQLDVVYETIEIEKNFLEDHLGLWVPTFCEKMKEQAHEDFFKGIARLTKGFIIYDQIWTSHLFHLAQNVEEF
jgi:TorA maturation chaperone TorD